MDDVIFYIALFQRELLLFAAFWFLIGAIDDLLVDIIWFLRFIYRKLRYYRTKPAMKSHELPPSQNSGKLAVFVPAWQEADVIGKMVNGCREAWSEVTEEFHVYLGFYPNDEATRQAAKYAINGDDNFSLVCCGKGGPSNKADCLNHIWRAMKNDEEAAGFRYKAVVLHDAEDKVHHDELRIYDRLLDYHSAIQLPVLPIAVKNSPFISGHYCDEFAEAHGKSMVVREALGVAVPLAGVGCAIDRELLGRIAHLFNKRPFNEGSLTEDYELGHKIKAFGGDTIMVRMLDRDGELTAIRACFPAKLVDSVRQKTRWIIGIALSGWDNVRWRGSLIQKWMLLRDRRAPFAAIVLTLAYAALLLTAGMQAAGYFLQIDWPALPETTMLLIKINAIWLMWRLIFRVGFTASLYGKRQALLAIPRSIIGNIIAIMAARRACFQYARHLMGKANMAWDKTSHMHFPDEKTR